MMTVKDLIKALRNAPPKAQVHLERNALREELKDALKYLGEPADWPFAVSIEVDGARVNLITTRS